MDASRKANRRSSILKVRQQVDLLNDETQNTISTNDRRVSFQNVKHVKRYDKDAGVFLHSSPLKEKITDTMDSDGILTPRGRHAEASQLCDNTMQIFNSVPAEMKFDSTRNTTVDMSIDSEQVDVVQNCSKRTVVDMSLDESALNSDDTMRIFNTTRERTTVVIEETTVTTSTRVATLTTIPDSQNCDDTMEIFNISNMKQVVPNIQTNSHLNKTTREPEDMDIEDSQSCSMLTNEKRVFDIPSQSLPENNSSSQNMNRSSVDMEIVDNTMNLFNMTERGEVDMDIERTESPSQNSTIVQQQVNLFNIPLTPTETPQTKEELTSNVENKNEIINKSVNMSVDMDLQAGDEGNNTVLPDETMAIFQNSICKSEKPISRSVVEDARGFTACPVDGGDDMDITGITEKEKSENHEITILAADFNNVTEKSMNFVESEREKTMICEEEQTVHETDLTLKTSAEKTMDISCEMDFEATEQSPTTNENSPIEKSHHETSWNVSQSTIHQSMAATSQVESPRRMTTERSMICTEPDSLREFKRRKSSPNDSILNITGESGSTSFVKRDIFDLNTSLRTSVVGSPIAVKLPVFDPAVSNIVWADDDVEMREINRIVDEEVARTNTLIGNLKSQDGSIEKTIEKLERGIMCKLSFNEKDVVHASRYLAEIEVLEMRAEFARNCQKRYESEVSEVGKEIQEIEGVIKEVQTIDVLKIEVEKLRSLRLEADVDEVKEEWVKLKKDTMMNSVWDLAQLEKDLDEIKAIDSEFNSREFKWQWIQNRRKKTSEFIRSWEENIKNLNRAKEHKKRAEEILETVKKGESLIQEQDDALKISVNHDVDSILRIANSNIL